MDWLLFLTQLPARPSSLRVNVWRRMKAAGAVSLQNGVWILPLTSKNQESLTEIQSFIRSEDGDSMFFIVKTTDDAIEKTLVEKFKAGILQEYGEFKERCRSLEEELEKESKGGKFTFAELDENEEELQKLTSWLRKILARDFFQEEKNSGAVTALDHCRKELQKFEKAVYKSEGLHVADE